MNQIVNKFLLEGDKFISEIHLRQLGFIYSACGPFTRNKQRIQEFMQTGDTNYIYRNELDKACFEDDMVYPQPFSHESYSFPNKQYNSLVLYCEDGGD